MNHVHQQQVGYQWTSASFAGTGEIDVYLSEIYPTQHEACCACDADVLETVDMADIEHVEIDEPKQGENSLWYVFNPPVRETLIRWDIHPAYKPRPNENLPDPLPVECDYCPTEVPQDDGHYTSEGHRVCRSCYDASHHVVGKLVIDQRISKQVRCRITVDGDNRGVSTWKDKQDFYGFIDLMHGKGLSLDYKQGVRRFIFSHQDEIKMYEYEEVDNLT